MFIYLYIRVYNNKYHYIINNCVWNLILCEHIRFKNLWGRVERGSNARGLALDFKWTKKKKNHKEIPHSYSFSILFVSEIISFFLTVKMYQSFEITTNEKYVTYCKHFKSNNLEKKIMCAKFSTIFILKTMSVLF